MPCNCVHVRPFVQFNFLDEALGDEVVEVRIETAVIDLLLVVVVEFSLDCEPVWFLKSSSHISKGSRFTRRSQPC